MNSLVVALCCEFLEQLVLGGNSRTEGERSELDRWATADCAYVALTWGLVCPVLPIIYPGVAYKEHFNIMWV